MFTLAAPPEPEWLTLIDAIDDVPAVRVLFAPIGPNARDAAQAATMQVMAGTDSELREEVEEAFEDGKLTKPLSAAAAHYLKLVGKASSAAMIREGIREWSGIGDPDGKPVPVSAKSIDWFLRDELLFARADKLYVLPVALLDAEKNASAGSHDGTGTQATPELNTAS